VTDRIIPEGTRTTEIPMMAKIRQRWTKKILDSAGLFEYEAPHLLPKFGERKASTTSLSRTFRGERKQLRPEIWNRFHLT